MHRRSILWAAASAFGAAFAASRASAATEAPAANRLKVVYHLSDLDKVAFVVGNIQNHLDGVGGGTMSPSRWSFTARRYGRSISPRQTRIYPGMSVSSPKPVLNSPPAATR